MPEVCNKCRSCRPLSGDTWCVGCGAWEVIGQELTSGWEGPPGLREVANDLVLGAARSIRALRSLGAGVSRASGKTPVPEPALPPKTPAASTTAEAAARAASSKKAASRPADRPADSEYTYTLRRRRAQPDLRESWTSVRRCPVRAGLVQEEKELQDSQEQPLAVVDLFDTSRRS